MLLAAVPICCLQLWYLLLAAPVSDAQPVLLQLWWRLAIAPTLVAVACGFLAQGLSFQ